MKTNNNAIRMLIQALVLGVTLVSGVAEAKGLFILNTGDEMFEVADEPALAAAGEHWKLGYKCKHFGVLWADVWTWDCHMAAVNVPDNSYADLPGELLDRLQSKYTLGDVHRGVWNHYGIWIILAALVLMGITRRSQNQAAV